VKAFFRLGLTVVLVLAVSSACGTTTDSSDTAAPTGQPTRAGTPSAVSARPQTITAACPLLPVEEVVRVLGGAEGSGLEATEGPKETGPSGTRLRCTYGRGDRQALVLGVAEQEGEARAGVDAAVTQSGATGTDVPGLGDAAATHTVGGFRYLVTAVSWEKGHRLVFLGAPAVVPKTKLAELAASVVKRI
jgi:hypothetical protein